MLQHVYSCNRKILMEQKNRERESYYEKVHPHKNGERRVFQIVSLTG